MGIPKNGLSEIATACHINLLFINCLRQIINFDFIGRVGRYKTKTRL